MQFPWKNILPFKTISIKKWLKEIKLKRKEEERLQKAEVHAAISVAGVAAALAAIAAENSKKDESSTAKEAAIASAAALVAAKCAQVAEAMGAKREQLSSAIGSAMSGTNASDIVTLTAAATTCKFLQLFFCRNMRSAFNSLDNRKNYSFLANRAIIGLLGLDY
jgi:hypothetical protein